MKEKINIKGLEGIINTQEELNQFYKKFEEGKEDINNGRFKSADEVFEELRRKYSYR